MYNRNGNCPCCTWCDGGIGGIAATVVKLDVMKVVMATAVYLGVE